MYEKSYHNLNFIRIWPEKTFFEGWSWFKLNNLGLALGTNLKFCTSVARNFWGPNLTFVEVTGEKLVGGASWIGLSISYKFATSSPKKCMYIPFYVITISTISQYIPILFNFRKCIIISWNKVKIFCSVTKNLIISIKIWYKKNPVWWIYLDLDNQKLNASPSTFLTKICM